MKRPRLALSLFNPQRRLRDRILAAMLVVALVPGAAFFLLTATSLNGITKQTVTGAETSIVSNQEQTFQNGLEATAATDIEQEVLEAVRKKVQLLADAVGGSSTSASPSASPSPSASASSKPASTTPSASSLSVLSQTGGVSEIGVTGFPSASAELLVGSAPSANPQGIIARAQTLAGLSSIAAGELALTATKVGSDVDAVWIMDTTDNAVWISPGDVNLPSGGQVSGNPQGAMRNLITQLAGQLTTSSTSLGTATASSDFAWTTTPYQNPLHNDDWEETVVSLASNDLLVGADVQLSQFAPLLSQAPSQANSYPLLLDGSNQVIAASPSTDGDFHSALQVGSALPAAVGAGGRALTAGLDAAEGGEPVGPINATLHGVDRLFFVAPVSDTSWVLVDSVPEANFEPDVPALRTGIDHALTNIFVGSLWIVAVLLVLAFLLATLLSRYVVAPVRALTTSAERLAKGHTDEPVPAQSRDEVGDLADSLERMRREINASREVILAASRELEQKVAVRTSELSARNEELLALNELAGSLTRSLDPGAILSGALEAVRAVLPTTAGRGYRLGRDGHLVAGTPEAGESGPLLEGIAAAAIADNHLVTRPDGEGVLIGLPMGTGAGPLGALGLRATVRPGVEMTALLLAIGNQVGLALSTARLSDEGREMAVLEERARLAREIHDTLAQQLTGIVIQLEAAQALVNRDRERSLPALASAQELARSALAEARRSVWDLRPAPLSVTGLVAAAEAEVERFRHRTGIAARLRSEHMAPPPALPPQSEVTLLRITQQALANIAAHSGATRVAVRLRNLGDHVELTVRDNGHGFDTSALPLGSFGIVGMAERARIAGGSFEVESASGRGTTITVRLPVVSEAGAEGAAPRAAVPV
jgi:two-component system NarL family sensor kinase